MHPESFEPRKARAGQPFTIRVRSNPTTGFAWRATYNADSVVLLDRSFEPGSGAIGGGGEERFTFRADHPGSIIITLELRRPWEKGARESRVYHIAVNR